VIESVNTEAFTGFLKTMTNKFGENTLPAHAATELCIIVTASPDVINQTHDMPGAIGIMILQPFTEQILDFMWQTQHDITGMTDACLHCSLQHCFQFRFVDDRYDRCEHNAGRDTGLAQALQALHAAGWCGCPRLQFPGQLVIQCGNGNKDLCLPSAIGLH